ncbi:hypothetical protein PUMCH_002710 [Australozyma saopauloensis]|uniref:PIG-P domain-containing protein n=1 Tax=Australozyma saopauloensis TaxID=291208 RepID=A0AAX4HA17_9ASCO|nr:hypothetical protein PUMCH_002710 [[Candida] saopauloensis]
MEAVRNEMQNFLSRSSTPLGRLRSTPVEEDKLARESDVTVATNSTLYAEYKGFFIYVSSAVALIFYILWILVPDLVLLKLGISYYPDKYWAYAVPMYLLMLMLFTYVFVALYNTEVKTQKLNSPNNFIDAHTVYPDDPAEYIWKAPSGVWDLPIGLVNDVLYDEEYIELALSELNALKNVISTNLDLLSPPLLTVNVPSQLLDDEAVSPGTKNGILQEVWDELLNGSSLSNTIPPPS